MVSENINRLLIAFGNACLEMGKAYKPNNADELNAATQATMDTAGALRNAIASLESKLADAQARLAWIPVSERLPEDRATVLVAFTEYPEQIDILTATYYKHYEGFGGVDNWWDIEGWHSGNVTHWMPLPKLPEVK